MNQIAVLPLVSRHSQSDLPSPLKSRCPTIDQAGGTAPTHPDDITCAPLMSHTDALPLVSRHAMSLLPSPLGAWVAPCTGEHDPPTVTGPPAEGMPLATT